MISKDDAYQLTVNYYTWRSAADTFLRLLDNNIKNNAQHGIPSVQEDLPQTPEFNEDALNMVLSTLSGAGYTEIEVDHNRQTISIYWGDVALGALIDTRMSA